jgi:hypothetical protein
MHTEFWWEKPLGKLRKRYEVNVKMNLRVLK